MYNESGDMFGSYRLLTVRNGVITESVEIVNNKILKHTIHIKNVRDARFFLKKLFRRRAKFFNEDPFEFSRESSILYVKIYEIIKR